MLIPPSLLRDVPTAWRRVAAAGAALCTLAIGTLATGAPASAQDVDAAAKVFVSPFQPVNRDATAMALLLPGYLERELNAEPGLQVVPLDDVGLVHDTPADAYLGSCPTGEFIGCAFVVAEVAQADFAIAGTLETLSAGSRVQVHIIDVTDAREVLSFQADLGVGDDAVFAEGVARVLVAVARGEVGGEQDIRELDDPHAEVRAREEAQKAMVAGQLEQLGQEIGDVTTLAVRDSTRIERPKVTEEDIADEMTREGVKPWERLGMTPSEYIRYQNSGWPLYVWRERVLGRKGQLLIRPALGFARGPTSGAYYAKYIRSAADLSVIERYGWQSIQQGNGLLFGASVGYGVLPILDVGATIGGAALGSFEVQIHAETEGQSRTAPEPDPFPMTSFFVGPRVLFAPFQTLNARPVIGGELVYWRGAGVERFVQLQEGLPTFGDPAAITVGALVGVEARMGDAVDLYLHVPLSAVVAELNTGTYSEGGGYITEKLDPPGLATTGAGVQIGLQVRLFGAEAQGRTDESFGDPDADL